MPRVYIVAPIADRFWPKVDRRGADECWPWTASRSGNKYGKIGEGPRDPITGKGTMLKAHRVSWELHNGPIPHGMCVLHKCDNPPCVNPRHLFLGTKMDNVKDMYAKGRARNGQKEKTECSNGHPYTEANVYHARAGHRTCRECHRQGKARQRSKDRDATRAAWRAAYYRKKARLDVP